VVWSGSSAELAADPTARPVPAHLIFGPSPDFRADRIALTMVAPRSDRAASSSNRRSAISECAKVPPALTHHAVDRVCRLLPDVRDHRPQASDRNPILSGTPHDSPGRAHHRGAGRRRQGDCPSAGARATRHLPLRPVQLSNRERRRRGGSGGPHPDLPQDCTLRAVGAFSGWLLSMVRRTCWRLARAVLRDAVPLEAISESARVAIRDHDELRLDLANAIQSLPEHYRQIVLMRDVDELTIDEIAQAMPLRREAVKGRLHRARGLVRAHLLG
jgi:Sigma-70, region 4